MPPTSSFVAVVIPVRKQKSFLDLPPEVRLMIYDYTLPDVIRVQKQPHFDLAVLRASRVIYREAREILKKRVFLSVKIEDRRTHTLALRWIDWLGRRGGSTNIRSLRIDTWIESCRTTNKVTFQRCIFRVSSEAPLGLLVKFTVPPRTPYVTYRYDALRCKSTLVDPAYDGLDFGLPCLGSRPSWSDNLRMILHRPFRNMPLYSADITIDKSGLKMIVDEIIAYSEYYSLWRPLKGFNVEEVAVKEVRHSGGHHPANPSTVSRWGYLDWLPSDEIVDPNEWAE
ncbi:MAG: hypothetical protein Q9203_005215 [Teloschistes exilis]